MLRVMRDRSVVTQLSVQSHVLTPIFLTTTPFSLTLLGSSSGQS